MSALPPIIGETLAGRTTLLERLARSPLAQLAEPSRPRLVVLVDWRMGLTDALAQQVALATRTFNPAVILVINKLDRAGFEYDAFKAARAQALAALSEVRVLVSEVVPISSKLGDGIERVTDRLEWYSGPTLVEALTHFAAAPARPNLALAA